MFAPGATPPAAIARLNRDIVAALTEPETRATVEGMGLEVVASTPEALGQYVEGEYKRWITLAHEAQIKFD